MARISRVLLVALLGTIIWGAAEFASAQVVPKPQARRFQPARPTFSPYLELYRRDSGVLPNYYTFYKRNLDYQAQVQQQAQINQQEMQNIQQLQSSLQQLNQGAPQTGMGSRYSTHGGYFNNHGGRFRLGAP